MGALHEGNDVAGQPGRPGFPRQARRLRQRPAVLSLRLGLVRRAAGEFPHGLDDARRILGVEQAGRRLLLGGVMPLWPAAALGRWYLHRPARTQRTAGPRGSALHSLMFAGTGVTGLLWRFWGVNASLL